MFQLKDFIASEHPLTIEWNTRVSRGFRAARDDHLIGGHFPLRLAIPRCQADRVGIDKHRVRFPKLNAVTAELMADDVNFITDHPIRPGTKGPTW